MRLELKYDVPQTPPGNRKQCVAVKRSSLIVWIHNWLGLGPFGCDYCLLYQNPSHGGKKL